MKKIFLSWVMLLCTVHAFSQPAITGTEAPSQMNTESEHRLIQEERSRAEAQYKVEEAACYRRFAVADCIRQLRVQRRDVFDKLRRREVVFNDAERKRKAMEILEQIKDKSSPQRIEEGALRRREALEAQQEREDQAFQKKKPAPVAGRNKEDPVASGRTAEEVSIELQQYSEKLKEAQAHRLSQEKANSDKSKGSFKPLPTPP